MNKNKSSKKEDKNKTIKDDSIKDILKLNIEYVSYKKVLILGEEGSGKSSLTSRFENEFFTEQESSEKSN